MYNKAHTTNSCDIHFFAEDLHEALLIILPFKIQFFSQAWSNKYMTPL